MRLATRIQELPSEMRFAGGAAAALVLAMLLPWYEKSYFVANDGAPVAVSDKLTALQAFTFVEAAALLVAGGVLYLIWARSERMAFQLPGGDGFVISLAGGWSEFLLIWRLFDKPAPDDPTVTVGIQWGIFAAMAAAAALIAAGARVRAVRRPEPSIPVTDDAADAPTLETGAVTRPVADEDKPTASSSPDPPPVLVQPQASSIRWVGPGPPPWAAERPDTGEPRH